MKRNPDFLLRDVAGQQVIVPVGAAAEKFPGMITINDTGAFLWELLEQEQTIDSLVTAMQDRYEVTEELARKDAKAFVDRLIPTGAVSNSR